MGRLLRASSHARSICLKYPDTAIQVALGKIPQRIASILHVASVFEGISDDNFNADEMIELLKYASLVEWPVRYPQLFVARDDVLRRMQSMADIYAEVNVAADIVAQAMNAATETCLHPHVVVTAISLSATERTRMVCALLLVRIYYQLRFKFDNEDYRRARNFTAAFMQTLAPWYMAQGLSIEGFLNSCAKYPGGLFDKIIDKRYTCGECLSQKSAYLREYTQVAVVDIETGYFAGQGSDVFRYSDAVEAEEDRRRQECWGGYRQQAQFPGWGQATLLCNHGWTMCDSYGFDAIMQKELVLSCGILFWDQSRLADWGLVDQGDVAEMSRQRVRQILAPAWYYEHSLQEDCEEETRSQQLVEWTRAFTQISFEEFLAKQDDM